MPVIVIAPHDQLFEKTASNMQEVAARGGRIILITDAKGAAECGITPEATIIMPEMDPLFAPIVYALPVQMIAYRRRSSWARMSTSRATSPNPHDGRVSASEHFPALHRDSFFFFRAQCRSLCFDAFSSREPVSTSLENALFLAGRPDGPRDIKAGRERQKPLVHSATGGAPLTATSPKLNSIEEQARSFAPSCDGACCAPTPAQRPEPLMAEQPGLEARRGAREAPGRCDEKDRARHQQQHEADHAEPGQDPAALRRRADGAECRAGWGAPFTSVLASKFSPRQGYSASAAWLSCSLSPASRRRDKQALSQKAPSGLPDERRRPP